MSTGQYLHQVCVIIRTPRSAALEALDKVQNGDDLHSRMPGGLLLENVDYLYVSIWIFLVRGRCITLGNLIPSYASIFTNRVICLMSSSWNHDKWRHPVSRFFPNPNSRHSAINLSVFLFVYNLLFAQYSSLVCDLPFFLEIKWSFHD